MNRRKNVVAEFRRQSLILLAVGLAASAAVADDLTGTAEVTMIDAGSQAATTARVEILDAQGKAYVSDDALPISVDGGQPSNSLVNPYTGKIQFYADGLVRATLPAGSYQFTAIKGIEYRKSVQTVEVKAGQETKLTMQLDRWADMPSANWYSADGELHIARSSKAANPGIARWMQAEDNRADLGQFSRGEFSTNCAIFSGSCGSTRRNDSLAVAVAGIIVLRPGP